MKVTKFAAAIVAAGITLTTLSGCTMSDQRIIDSFMEPKTIAHPTVIHDPDVVDPSISSRSETPITGTSSYTVKVYGSADTYRIYADGKQTNYSDTVTVPRKILVQSEQDRIVAYVRTSTYAAKGAVGGCTILDSAGNILDKQKISGKSRWVACAYGED